MNLSQVGPTRSEKNANFRRLAQARTQRVLEVILRKLANLSSPNYEFEDAEVEIKSFPPSRMVLRRRAVASAETSPNRSRWRVYETEVSGPEPPLPACPYLSSWVIWLQVLLKARCLT